DCAGIITQLRVCHSQPVVGIRIIRLQAENTSEHFARFGPAPLLGIYDSGVSEGKRIVRLQSQYLLPGRQRLIILSYLTERDAAPKVLLRLARDALTRLRWTRP